HDVALAYFGVLWAACSLTTGVAGKATHKLEHLAGPLFILFLIGLLPVAAYFGMALVGGYAGVAFGLLFYVCRGFNYVMLKDVVNWRAPSQFRGTINSIQSFFFRLGFALFGPVVGMGIDKLGMNTMLGVLGGVFAVLFVVIMLPLIVT